MAKRVLIVEDDRSIARVLRDNLQFEGFLVEWSETGRDALQKAKEFLPDLVLLDLMLPKGFDALGLCRTLTQGSDSKPVIIVTARGQKDELVRGLSAGADDYVIKPFAFEELLARINAVIRRTKPRVERLTLGPVEIDFRRLLAFRDSQEIDFTDREFEILRYLAERAGMIVTRDELLRLVWGYSDTPNTRTVDNFIFRLRNKLEADPRHPKFIRTVYGEGYRLTLHE